MDLWHLALFVAASLLALRSFITLTSHHQRLALRRMAREAQEAASASQDAQAPARSAA